MPKPITEREKERMLRIAYEALDECNKNHERTGRDKIPLDEIAEVLGISKAEIQEAFDLLVQEHVIADDGDRDHMNYSGSLLDLIAQLLQEYVKQRENDEEEKEEVISYIE